MSTTPQVDFIKGATMVVQLRQVEDVIATDPALKYRTDLAVTATAYDADDAPIAGAEGIACPYVVGTTGRATTYRGKVPSTVGVDIDDTGRIEFSITDDDGNARPINLDYTVVRG